ncbi:MAG: polyprenyl synthetase family protein, partial [Bacteroides sp.]
MDMLSAITSPVTDELVQFKELFDSSLTNSNPLLNEVLMHICQRRGKMMRPILVLLVAKLSGEISESTFHAAVALELLHTASLVHDDVVDESGERRGQLSVNAMYNNRISVLVGDYLLATCLVQSSLTKNNDIVGVIARLGQDLSEGELLQLSNVSNS